MKRYVIQECHKQYGGWGWYDHPDLNSFKSLFKAEKILMVERETTNPASGYRYRLIERDERVLYDHKQRPYEC